MRKFIALLAAFAIIATLAGCSNSGEVDELNKEIDELNETIDELNEDIEGLEAQVEEYETQIADYEAQAEAKEGAVSVADEEAEASAPQKDVYTIGDTFIFDELEITLVAFRVEPVGNRYADVEEAVLIDVTVKNLSAENHGLNMFYYNCYGSKGTQLDSTDAYFDEAIAFMGDMRPDATQEGSLCFEYDGDGEYFIEFDDYSQVVNVSVQVVKP